jgi:replicative DNA helicase
MKLSSPIYQLKRRAKTMARDENIALHMALDRIAQGEGFSAWSLLSARAETKPTIDGLLSHLSEGDLLLLGSRPRQGKTLLGLKLLLDAIRQGRRGVFFTLEYTEQETQERLKVLADSAATPHHALEIVTSDRICADSIIRHLADAPRGTVAVIDYLQILDQRRSEPVLSEQMNALQKFARQHGVILGFISQIDRSFDPNSKALPDIDDIRLPNYLDTGIFSKALFLHNGQARLQNIA